MLSAPRAAGSPLACVWGTPSGSAKHAHPEGGTAPGQAAHVTPSIRVTSQGPNEWHALVETLRGNSSLKQVTACVPRTRRHEESPHGRGQVGCTLVLTR